MIKDINEMFKNFFNNEFLEKYCLESCLICPFENYCLEFKKIIDKFSIEF